MSEKEAKKAPYLVVLKDKEPQTVLDWYHWLHNDKQKGVRARLKRCASLEEVIIEPGFLRLNQALPRLSRYNLMGIALIAAILAVAKIDVAPTLATLLGKAKEGSDKPMFSELRFQRLLASDSEEQFFQNIRRAVVLAGEKANPLLLADSLLHWHREQHNPDWFKGNRQWQYQTAKSYYTEVFIYQKGA